MRSHSIINRSRLGCISQGILYWSQFLVFFEGFRSPKLCQHKKVWHFLKTLKIFTKNIFDFWTKNLWTEIEIAVYDRKNTVLFNSPHADTIHSFGLQSTENPNCIRSIGTPWQSISLAQTHEAKRQASKVLASQYWRPIFRGRIFKLKLKFYYANRPCRFQK